MRRTVVCLLAAAAFAAGAAHAAPIDGTFNYQGRLTSGGAPITGIADVRFSLWDAAGGGAQFGPTITYFGSPVTGGLFNADLDFGVAALNGDMRWLQIEVRSPAGVGGFVNLGRQEVLGAPYAVQTRGIFVDSALNVGVGTTAPAADLHVGDTTPTMLVRDQSGATLSGIGLDGNSFFRLQTFHPQDGNTSSALVDSFWGGQWQSFDREGGGFFGIVGALGNSGISGDGFIELFSKEGGFGATVTINADGNNNVDDNEFGYIGLGSSGASGQGGTASIRNNDGWETINLLGGGSGGSGALSLFNSSTGDTTVRLDGDIFGYGGQMSTYSEDGFSQSYFEPDFNGEGMFVTWYRDNSNNGLIFNGNDGSGGCELILQGAASSMFFDTGVVGGSSVSLPTDAIQDTEILDEAGAASATSDGAVSLTGGIDILLSRTITCPTSGYCLVVGSCQANFNNHTIGTTSNADYGVSDTSIAFPANQEVAYYIHSGNPSGLYTSPITTHGLFSVGAGANTFYLLGRENTGSATVNDMQLSIIFVPTAYGTVSPTLLARRGAGDDASSPQIPALSPADVAAERLEAVAFDQNRRAAEAADYNARFAELQAQLQQVLREQESMRQEMRRASPPSDTSGAALASPLGHNDATTR